MEALLDLTPTTLLLLALSYLTVITTYRGYSILDLLLLLPLLFRELWLKELRFIHIFSLPLFKQPLSTQCVWLGFGEEVGWVLWVSMTLQELQSFICWVAVLLCGEHLYWGKGMGSSSREKQSRWGGGD